MAYAGGSSVTGTMNAQRRRVQWFGRFRRSRAAIRRAAAYRALPAEVRSAREAEAAALYAKLGITARDFDPEPLAEARQ